MEDDEDDGLPPFPDLASYVTIKLDPLMSVGLLEDEEATMAAKRMANKTYVGYVGDVLPIFSFAFPNYSIK